MQDKYDAKRHCYRILEGHGGKVAEKVREILLEEISVGDLRSSLRFLSENWRDVFTPALTTLSCEAVGGPPEMMFSTAVAMTLMNLSLNVWDHVVDKTRTKLFKPTLAGKFGEGTALIVGGLATAKAFSILNSIRDEEIPQAKRRRVSNLIFDFWLRMADAEAMNLRLRSQSDVRPREKYQVLKMQACFVEACSKVGAVLGGGSSKDIEHLGKYGLYLGTILELRKDFDASLNLTLQLADKIKTNALPYTLLWAQRRSQTIRKHLTYLTEKKVIQPVDIKMIVEETCETGAIEHLNKIFERLTKKGIRVLTKVKGDKENKGQRAIQLLKYLLEAQHHHFIERLSAFRF